MRDACVVLVVLSLASSARASLTSELELVVDYAEHVELRVARVCYLEGSFRTTDCAGFWHVAVKRAAASMRVDARAVTAAQALAMLERYSAIGEDNPRAREVRAYPDRGIAGKSGKWNAGWARLRVLAVELVVGQERDPCPRALHWGGVMDAPRGGMIAARCAGQTANTFYAVAAAGPRKARGLR